jgi:hypothetical protein
MGGGSSASRRQMRAVSIIKRLPSNERSSTSTIKAICSQNRTQFAAQRCIVGPPPGQAPRANL